MDDSLAVVELLSRSIANHVNNWLLAGRVGGFSELPLMYWFGLTDMDSSDTTEPFPRIMDGLATGRLLRSSLSM